MNSRLSRYDEALQTLLDSGRAYPCYETQEELSLKRKSQLMAGKPPVYDRAALALSDTADKQKLEAEGRQPRYRFRLNHEQVTWTDLVRGDVAYHMSSLSDPVLMREDGRVIYTLASVVDDIDHGITAILRGEDHVTNSAAQIRLRRWGHTSRKWGIWRCWLAQTVKACQNDWAACLCANCVKRGLRHPWQAGLLARIDTSVPVVPQASLPTSLPGLISPALAGQRRNSRLMSSLRLMRVSCSNWRLPLWLNVLLRRG